MTTVPGERERFEKWAVGTGRIIDKFSRSGQYKVEDTHAAWEAWQDQGRTIERLKVELEDKCRLANILTINAEAAIQAERERCAKIAKGWAKVGSPTSKATGQAIADAIRRGEGA